MPVSRELVKVVVQAVVLERDEKGAIVGETTSQPLACYTPDQLVAFHAQASVEVADFNAAQPNRQQRRRQPKKKGGKK